MIFLMFLAGFVLWLIVAIMICKKIPHWLDVPKHGPVISVLLFPVVLVAPVADEIIGRWQFNRLCEREAVVTLSPDWAMVKRARERDIPSVTLNGYLIRIQSQRAEYFDIDTGKNFLTNQAFHAYGGFLVYRMGLGLGTSTSCWPKDDDLVYKKNQFAFTLKARGNEMTAIAQPKGSETFSFLSQQPIKSNNRGRGAAVFLGDVG